MMRRLASIRAGPGGEEKVNGERGSKGLQRQRVSRGQSDSAIRMLLIILSA